LSCEEGTPPHAPHTERIESHPKGGRKGTHPMHQVWVSKHGNPS
jgi:hypothetical protein